MSVEARHARAALARARPGAHVARAALMLSGSAVESGHGCPISMTYAAVPGAAQAARARRGVGAAAHVARVRPAHDPVEQKPGALCGMAMTERQGGSDVRANTTIAPSPERRRRRRRVRASPATSGSARRRCATSFLVLAQTEARRVVLPAAALHARRRAQPLPHQPPEGQARQPLERVERDRARRRLGAHGRRGGPRRPDDHRDGQPHAARLRARLDRAHARRPWREATHHTAHRSRVRQAADRPAADAERARRPVHRVRGGDRSPRCGSRAPTTSRRSDEEAMLFKRLATAVSKYWICKSAVWIVGEALECFGGNGYVEESGMPRLFRETPLQLDLGGLGQRQRARRAARDGAHAGSRWTRSSASSTLARRRRAAARRLRARAQGRRCGNLEDIEFRARRVVERMALALQGSVLVRHGDPAVADAFCATRLARRPRALARDAAAAGSTPGSIVERHRPSAAVSSTLDVRGRRAGSRASRSNRPDARQRHHARRCRASWRRASSGPTSTRPST